MGRGASKNVHQRFLSERLIEAPPAWSSPERMAWPAIESPRLSAWLRRIFWAHSGAPSGMAASAPAPVGAPPAVPMVDVPPVAAKRPSRRRHSWLDAARGLPDHAAQGRDRTRGRGVGDAAHAGSDAARAGMAYGAEPVGGRGRTRSRRACPNGGSAAGESHAAGAGREHGRAACCHDRAADGETGAATAPAPSCGPPVTSPLAMPGPKMPRKPGRPISWPGRATARPARREWRGPGCGAGKSGSSRARRPGLSGR